MGCSVACVASRCGIDYRDALALFSFPENAWGRGFFCPEIIEALSKIGLNYSFDKRDVFKHESLLSKAGTIVFVEPSTQYACGHYYLRTQTGWMNPWANCPQMIPVESKIQKASPETISWIVFEN